MSIVSEKNSEKLKAIILCAGKGSRLRPLTDTVPKPLVPVANRPILFYIIDQIKQVGIEEIGIIISPKNNEIIKKEVGNGTDWNLKITYIIQTVPGGLAHAALMAEEFLSGSSFLMFLGDNLIHGSIAQFVNKFCNESCSARVLLKEVADPRHFGVAELDSDGRVVRLVEKPKAPKSNLALIGVYLFRSSALKAAKQIKPSLRGELEITDTIQWLIDHGENVCSDIICDWWLDTGKKEDLLTANKVILEDSARRLLQSRVDSESHVNGRVELGENVSVVNSTITGPVSIAGGCVIENSVINPYTSIGRETIIENSTVDYSIIMEKCHITNIAHLYDSVIGRETRITKKAGNEGTSKFFLGSHNKIEI